jgi:hypothetical protein
MEVVLLWLDELDDALLVLAFRVRGLAGSCLLTWVVGAALVCWPADPFLLDVALGH